MFYITSSPYDLVKYHLSKQYPNSSVSIHKELSIKEAGGVLLKGTPFKESLNIIISDFTAKEINEYEYRQNVYNHTYLISSKKNIDSWKKKIKDDRLLSVKVITIDPDLYKNNLFTLRGLFSKEAYEWIWSNFKDNPYKLEIELYRLVIEYGSRKRAFSLEEVISTYSNSTSIGDYRYTMGTSKGTEILASMSENELWTLLIGSNSRPPFIYYYLTSNGKEYIYHYLTYIQEVVIRGDMPLKIAAVLFNQWLLGIGYRNNSSVTIEQVNDLVNLLG